MSAQYFPVSWFPETKALVEDAESESFDEYPNQSMRLGKISTVTVYFGGTLMILTAILHLIISLRTARDTRLDALPRPDVFGGSSI